MTLHEMRTSHSPAEVIDLAEEFFTHDGSPYSAYAERMHSASIKLHLEVGEIVIGTQQKDGMTIVRASASRGAHLLTRFMMTLGRPQDARQTVQRHGICRRNAAEVETFLGGCAAPVNTPVPQAA